MFEINPGSFRDSANFVFKYQDSVFRAISTKYQEDYEALENAGMFHYLQERDFLIRHSETTIQDMPKLAELYKVIKPHQLSFISYPYEWCFSQFKDSALITLDLCLEALEKDFILKDASAFNIQMLDGKCLLIDSTSLTRYFQGQPWIAYRQFVMHFLIPLLLMSRISPNMNSMLRIYNEGIPLDLAKKLLPTRTIFNPCALFNVYLHEWLERKHQDGTGSPRQETTLSKPKLKSILQAMRAMIGTIDIQYTQTTWSDYYKNTSKQPESIGDKERLVLQLFGKITPKPKKVLDLAGNNGHFSRVLAPYVDQVIAADYDVYAVDEGYRLNKALGIKNVYPVTLDFRNPSGGTGWGCEERSSFFERSRSDLTIVLAFIHHLVLTENVPFRTVAKILTRFSPHLIIEFVGVQDAKVLQLLKNKASNHPYDEPSFVEAFSTYYRILDREPIPGTQRTLFRMERVLEHESQDRNISFH